MTQVTKQKRGYMKLLDNDYAYFILPNLKVILDSMS
jgi:hypothetical protein